MPRSQLVDTEEESSDTMQEPELIKLQRQMRVLENNRKSYMDEVKGVLRKQETEFDQLKRDNEEILLLLRLVKTNKNEQMTAKDSWRFLQLVEMYDSTKKKIDENKDMAERLDEDIDAMKKDYGHQQQLIGSVFRGSKKSELEKRIGTMENRLEKMMIQFNKQLIHNAKLRSQVDDVRQERRTYERIHKRLVQELENERSQINNLLTDATNSYGEREEARQKIITLKERNMKDSSQHEMEVRKYDRSLQHDKSLDYFMALKSKEHGTIKQETLFSSKKEGKDSFALRQQLEHYEEGFGRIRAIMGNIDLDDMITKFQENEEENFALFKYINELNTEIENHSENIRELEKDICELQQSGENKRKEIQDKIQTVKDKTLKVSSECDKGRISIMENQKVLEEFKDGIISLLKVVRCDYSNCGETSLATDSQLNQNSILQYMARIDQRITELMLIRQFLGIKKSQQQKTETPSFLNKPESAKINRLYLSVVPPNVD